jgi:hypothetical protein
MYSNFRPSLPISKIQYEACFEFTVVNLKFSPFFCKKRLQKNIFKGLLAKCHRLVDNFTICSHHCIGFSAEDIACNNVQHGQWTCDENFFQKYPK